MEGTLWKWTNYFSGWQPRWFVLENGILSYYKSQEDVDNGCKGSIKMSVCDVTVHHSDASRLDLIIPGEAHFYVKAATPQERQHWLVALGTAKAGQANGRHTPIKEEVPDESLKAKKSELRLYCDLLMQQVHSVKTAVQVKEGGPDIGQMDEATSLLSATCDTFIHALDECMQIAAASTSPLTVSPTNVPASPSRKSPSSRSVPWPTSVPPVQRSLSVDSSSLKSSRHRSASPEDTIVRGYIPGRRGSRSGHQRGSVVRTISESSDPTSAPPASPIVAPADNHIGESSHTAGAEAAVINGGDRIPTFFSDMKTTFQDVAVDSDGNIPTEVFLEACRSILPIFDKLSPTAFAPVMYDISGNIKKIHQKFLSDRGCFDCLQNMVLYEVGAKQQQHSSSATVALLWLKRALEFIVEFCVELLAGTDDLTTASNKAYTKTLKPFHNFVNRGAYALASKSIPSKTEFLGHLLSSSSSITMTSADPSVELLIKASLADYITSLQRVTQALHAFFSQSQLDSPEMV